MPRLSNVKERRHQPMFDTLVRYTGATGQFSSGTSISTQTQMFQQATTLGNPALTNLNAAGQLASDQTFLAFALRCQTYFEGLNQRALYIGVQNQLYFQFVAGDKPQFTAPAWYTPAGGGAWAGGGLAGLAATTGQTVVDPVNPIYNNGMPTPEAIMKLGRSIAIPVRQSFYVTATFYALGSTSVLTTLNSGDATDQKLITYWIDGLQTREVL